MLAKPARQLRRLPSPSGARRRRNGKESPLVTAILKALELRGVWAWRANSGAQVIKATVRTRRRVIKGAPAGTPDILLVLPQSVLANDFGEPPLRVGQLCGLEVKAAEGRQRLSQRLWEGKALQHGVHYRVVRSVREALAAVEEWR